MSDEFLSVRSTAALLSCTRRTIYRLLESGRLDAIRVGKAIRIPTSSIAGLPHYNAETGVDSATKHESV